MPSKMPSPDFVEVVPISSKVCPTLQEPKFQVRSTCPVLRTFPSLKKPPPIIDMSTDGILEYQGTKRVLFRGDTSNIVFDTRTTSLGIGVTGSNNPSSNLYITGNAYVSSNLAIGGVMTMGVVNVAARHNLQAVTDMGNVTTHTVEFTNPTTSIVASGNVTVGGDLDISGNLGSSLVNLVYPIGAVYISVNSADPGTIWTGTTWVAFGEGRTLVGQGQGSGLTNRPTVEAVGGAETHTLTKEEIPPHKHTYLGNYYDGTTDHGLQYKDTYAYSAYRQSNDTTDGSADGLNGDAHNIMQPFIVTYMWKRTA